VVGPVDDLRQRQKFREAVVAEQARVDAAPALTSAAQALQRLGEQVADPRPAPAQLHDLKPDHPLFGVRRTAVTADQKIEQALNKLAGRGPGIGYRGTPAFRWS